MQYNCINDLYVHFYSDPLTILQKQLWTLSSIFVELERWQKGVWITMKQVLSFRFCCYCFDSFIEVIIFIYSAFIFLTTTNVSPHSVTSAPGLGMSSIKAILDLWHVLPLMKFKIDRIWVLFHLQECAIRICMG